MAETRILDVRTTTRSELVDITSVVRNAIRASGVESGIACLFCPHTTAGLTIQENTNPSVRRDLLARLDLLVPRDGGYEHSEDNEDAHIKSSLLGVSLSLVVDGGRPHLGQWQAIYFCEFDGPRSRRLLLKVVAG
jgi:secondary thiamine-phosphate synthase enzyme